MLGLDNILYFSKDLLSPYEEPKRSGDVFDNGENGSSSVSGTESTQKLIGLSDQDLLVIQSKMNSIVER